MIILEEVNLPHPRCPWCDILVPWLLLNRRHLTTAQCANGVEIKRQQMDKEELRESVERAFQTYIRPLETVTSFKYMGRVLMAADYECPAVVRNFSRVQKNWERLVRILGLEGANPRVLGV